MLKTWQESLPPSLCPAHTWRPLQSCQKFWIDIYIQHIQRKTCYHLFVNCDLDASILVPSFAVSRVYDGNFHCLLLIMCIIICCVSCSLKEKKIVERIKTWRIFGRLVDSGSVAPQPATQARCPTEQQAKLKFNWTTKIEIKLKLNLIPY